MTLPRPSRNLNGEVAAVEQKPEKPKLNPNKYRPSDVFAFDPKADISIFELSLLIKLLYEPSIHFKSYLDLDSNLQRHFRPIKA